MELKIKNFFVQFKQTCNKHFILFTYNPKKLIQLKMDINNFVIKRFFIQKYNNKKHPTAYYSKKNIKNKIKL